MRSSNDHKGKRLKREKVNGQDNPVSKEHWGAGRMPESIARA